MRYTPFPGSRVRRSIAVAAISLTALVGCATSGPPRDNHPTGGAAATSRGTSSAAAPSGEPVAVPTTVPVPPKESARQKDLLVVKDRTGSAVAGRAAVHRGTVRIDVNCVQSGQDDLAISFGPLGEMTVPCDAATPVRNEMRFDGDHELTLTVTAASDALWSMRVHEE
ncbi:hypothetical protein [Streptomyces sp. NPDC051569]|uniref:hypothetical protein n=1 Tax=Streptomyces sp. NPDC051569 TaxID=3365661 RepID=UPI0037A379FE